MVGVNKEYNIIISLSHAWLKYDSTVMINALHCMHLSIIIPSCVVIVVVVIGTTKNHHILTEI